MRIEVLLREVRESYGISQSRLSAESGVCQPAISKIETGDRVPQLETLVRLGRALGVSEGDLYRVVEGDAEMVSEPVEESSNPLVDIDW